MGPSRTIYTYERGAIMLYQSSPQIRNCHLVDNAVGASEEGPHLDDFFCRGGAIMCGMGSSPLIENCLIRDNYASRSGGGIHFDDDAGGQVINNVISHNLCRFRGDGGGISMVDHSHPLIMGNLIIHSIALDNDLGGQGGGVYIYRSNPFSSIIPLQETVHKISSTEVKAAASG
jgi:parallel beta-helix repeat protein